MLKPSSAKEILGGAILLKEFKVHIFAYILSSSCSLIPLANCGI
jgi:hypothetical protein